MQRNESHNLTMSTAETFSPVVPSNSGEVFEYRALSTRAIASLVLGVLSLSILAVAAKSLQDALALSPLAVFSAILGVAALAQMRANPNQYSGDKLAVAGLLLAAFSLIAGLGYAGYVYATEVPPDYHRISFTGMRPDEVDLRAGRAVPPEISTLDGEKVFIKGYMRPDSTKLRNNIKRFLLVRDNNQCCFGDAASVKFFDQIDVQVADGVRLDKSLRLLRMAGTLHVDEQSAAKGKKLVFRLEADYAK